MSSFSFWFVTLFIWDWYISTSSSWFVPSSGDLSSLTLINLGNLKAIPFEGSIKPIAAKCFGDKVISAHLTSQTFDNSKNTSGLWDSLNL